LDVARKVRFVRIRDPNFTPVDRENLDGLFLRHAVTDEVGPAQRI
jgi:hypothetical protein